MPTITIIDHNHIESPWNTLATIVEPAWFDMNRIQEIGCLLTTLSISIPELDLMIDGECIEWKINVLSTAFDLGSSLQQRIIHMSHIAGKGQCEKFSTIFQDYGCERHTSDTSGSDYSICISENGLTHEAWYNKNRDDNSSDEDKAHESDSGLVSNGENSHEYNDLYDSDYESE
ncbi:hypothetical protein L208DRAFT_1375488 [Tricholoma matsutake]|nr:hypothetical protein L208DRAFT_1375488 [Tricholoma matsutake 945]